MPKSHLKDHLNHWTLIYSELYSKLVSSSHELGDSSSSTAPPALKFPRAWVRTQEFLSD